MELCCRAGRGRGAESVVRSTPRSSRSGVAVEPPPSGCALLAPEGGEPTAGGDEFMCWTDLDDPTLVEEHDLFGGADAGEPVGDDHAGA